MFEVEVESDAGKEIPRWTSYSPLEEIPWPDEDVAAELREPALGEDPCGDVEPEIVSSSLGGYAGSMTTS